MPRNTTDKPLFSFKETVYIISLVSGFFYQQYSFKIQLHDAVNEIALEKQIKTEQIAELKRSISAVAVDVAGLKSQISAAILPKKTKLEPEYD